MSGLQHWGAGRFSSLPDTFCNKLKEVCKFSFDYAKHCFGFEKKKILNSEDFQKPQRLMFQNEMKSACHLEFISGFHTVFTPYTSPFTKRKAAFTLAEVLITLGIIGIIAAMTLPALIQTNRNKEVEAKLQKIYSTMNQAILLSEIDNGPREQWGTSLSAEEFFKKYFLPYINNLSITSFNSYGGGNLAVYFSDGTALVTKQSGGYDYFFFPNAKNLNENSFAITNENTGDIEREGCGITYFAFLFTPGMKVETVKYNTKGFEPNKYSLEPVTVEAITTSNAQYACKKGAANKAWCAALIQLNGWKIPEDYPFKVR